MASSSDASSKQAFMELAKADRSGDYDRALKAANRILKNHPKETIAFKCKLVCLIQMSKFEDAVQLIRKTPPHQIGDCQFEKAYCEYRLNRSDEALKTLEQAGDSDFRCLELLAQLYYRLERFEDCHKVYKKLLKDHADSYEQERRANLLATEAQLQSLAIPQPAAKHLETYEQHYNAACRLIEAKEYTNALKELKTAEKLCRETLAEDDVPEEEIEDEVALIRTQSAFCTQALGDVDKALNEYLEVIKEKYADLEPCRRSLEELRAQFGLKDEAVLIEAALLVRQKDGDKAVALLQQYITDNKAAGPEIRFALVQIQLLEGKHEGASKALRSFPEDVRWRPGVLSLLVAIDLSAGRDADALKTLTDGIAHNQNNKSALPLLLDQCASLHAKLGDEHAAVKYMEELRKLEPDDPKVLARLIKLYSQVDPKKAEAVSRDLPPLAKEQSGFNVDELESSEWILFGERYRQKKGAKQTPKAGVAEDEQIIRGKLRSRKRKRKTRLPKNYDPNVQPDPERWLPKAERSSTKKRKDKRHKDRDIGRGTQGAVSGAVVAELDSSNKATVDVTSSPKPSPAPGSAEGPRQLRPPGAGQQAKKKKKKTGNKWLVERRLLAAFPSLHKTMAGSQDALVLVTGASGYLATHCVQQLLNAGYKVRGTVRSVKNEEKIAPLKALKGSERLQLVEADLTSEDGWDSALKDVTFVLHTASPLPGLTATDDSTITAAVFGTLNVLKAAAKAPTVKRVVLTSSSNALMDYDKLRAHPDHVFSEVDWPANLDNLSTYAVSKVKAERAALDFVNQLTADQHKFELVVIVPFLIFGPTLTDAVGASLGMVHGFLTKPMAKLPNISIPSVDVRDVAKAHILAMTAAGAAGERIAVVYQPSYRMTQLGRDLNEEFSSQGFSIPTEEMKQDDDTSALNPHLQILLKQRPYGADIKIDTTKMKKILGMDKLIDMKTSVIDSAYSFFERNIIEKREGYRGPRTAQQK
uniref:Signal recognition particle subunit SRP72 n=1 Tax=Plectus sambesii TaxID=2011161 RepID=A0A914V267_9BILA